ncbi:MAG: hypothetical protein AB1801_14945 [Chloroflexota bacterium]
MKILLMLLMIGSALALLLAGCGGAPPPLAEAGRPTLVFIYTEG